MHIHEYSFFVVNFQDAIRYENGREVAGSAIIVEWAKGNPRRTGPPSRDSRSRVSWHISARASFTISLLEISL